MGLNGSPRLDLPSCWQKLVPPACQKGSLTSPLCGWCHPKPLHHSYLVKTIMPLASPALVLWDRQGKSSGRWSTVAVLLKGPH